MCVVGGNTCFRAEADISKFTTRLCESVYRVAYIFYVLMIVSAWLLVGWLSPFFFLFNLYKK